MRRKLLGIFMVCMMMLTACGDVSVADGENKGFESESVTQAAVSAAATDAEAEPTKPPSPIRTLNPDRYVHGEDGYYCLDDDGVPVELRAQVGGTCWLFAAAVCMETGYERTHGGEIKIDPMKLLDKVYGEDKKEGYFVRNVGAREFGGFASQVVHTLSNGFDGYVLDRGIRLPDNETDTIKKYIKEYGAVYFAVPDTVATKKGTFDGYTTINHVTSPDNYDHSIAAVGWDDYFPKKYFVDTPSQDGAWLTANSQENADYYYVSYGTKPEDVFDHPQCMSMSDEYSAVASHDCGFDEKCSIKMKKGCTTANVFHKEGTLSAVGTYSLGRNRDITIEIYDEHLKNVIYTQTTHLPEYGYQVVKLDQPLEVRDYAIAITYSFGVAPVEGKGWKEENLVFKPTSAKGESFVKIGKKWYDLHERSTSDMLGRKGRINNACIKGLYAK